MIKFKNKTNLKDFNGMIKSGEYEITNENGYILIKHNLYNMQYVYKLSEIHNGLYFFESANDVPFSVLFRSNSTHIEILEGLKNGRKYKAERNLKQFISILCLANSVLLTHDF